MLVSANNGRVHEVQLPVDAPFCFGNALQSGEDLLRPNALLAPASEAAKDTLHPYR